MITSGSIQVVYVSSFTEFGLRIVFCTMSNRNRRLFFHLACILRVSFLHSRDKKESQMQANKRQLKTTTSYYVAIYVRRFQE